jgi:putative flippase GtrA
MQADLDKLRCSVSWFACVGALAALVHYVVAVGLERYLNIQPAWANIVGFVCAFPVSYIGHRTLSFPELNQVHQHTLPKFLSVAVFGFLANQTLVLLSLRYTTLPFWLVLAIVMVVVAISTYLLSRYWAFSHT